jgi:cell wall-associated NlpC family hydrolase
MANAIIPRGLTNEQCMAIRAAVFDIIGAPWKLLGRDPSGLDCLGMVLYLYGKAGIALPDPALTFGHLEDAPTLAGFFAPIPDAELRALGDVVQFPTGAFGTHLAVYWDGNLLQATEAHGVVQLPFRRFLMRKHGVTLSWYRYSGDPRAEEAAA